MATAARTPNTDVHAAGTGAAFVTVQYPSREEINRNRLLDGCVMAVAEHGLAAVKMNHIIERSGLSRRTAYNYFQNKADIVRAAYLREGTRLFEATGREVSRYHNVEDVFVFSFLYVCLHLPQNPLLRTLIHQNHELMQSLNVTDQPTIKTLLQDIDLGGVFSNYPDLLRDIYELSEYWVQTIASFLLFGIGKNKSPAEIERYIRKRFVPGLRLDEYSLKL